MFYMMIEVIMDVKRIEYVFTSKEAAMEAFLNSADIGMYAFLYTAKVGVEGYIVPDEHLYTTFDNKIKRA